MSAKAKKPLSEPLALLNKLLKIEMNKNFDFICDAGKGQNLLHRIRVELSRLRTKAVQRGMTPKHFKIIHVSTELVKDDAGKEKVTIRRTRSENNVSDEIHELFSEIAHPKSGAA